MTMTSSKARFRHWLDSPALGESEWRELNELTGNDEEIENRFYAPLEFGTAGLRGVMGMGLHRMNVHVIRHATQAFAQVIRAQGEDACKKGIVICFDCRENSALFAREAAQVMAGNGIQVRIFDALRPTPELSFAIRHYGATAGINITASHNPREYNGYKVYWSDGAQLPPAQADEIARIMGETDIFTGIRSADYDEALASGQIVLIGQETDAAFLEKVMAQSIDAGPVHRMADKLQIVYTPFHGTGCRMVPEALRRLGVTKLVPVEAQMIPDGSFPTVKSPNPEESAGFAMAIELAKKTDSALIIGTDPDADRVGVVVRSGAGEYVVLSGNQVGVLLLDYIIHARKAAGTLPADAIALKSIVTTEMAREVCSRAGVRMEDTFTGFKFMAERLAQMEAEGEVPFLMAFEESIGYMIGDFVRDKDAVTASVMIAEMAAWHLEQGRSLLDALDALYESVGYFAERTVNLVMPGLDGLEKMRAIMQRLREQPLSDICGVKVLRMRDYLSGRISVADLGPVGETHIVGSDVLYFELSDGTSFIVRPSGTEPKIKVYILARGESKDDCRDKTEKYGDFALSLTQ